MKFIVESAEDGIVLLKNEEDETITIQENDFGFPVRTGMTVIEDGGVWSFDKNDETERRKRIAEKRKLLLGKK